MGGELQQKTYSHLGDSLSRSQRDCRVFQCRLKGTDLLSVFACALEATGIFFAKYGHDPISHGIKITITWSKGSIMSHRKTAIREVVTTPFILYKEENNGRKT